jgi:hypothetical protein
MVEVVPRSFQSGTSVQKHLPGRVAALLAGHLDPRATCSCRPASWARHTGTRPTHDTRFGSSKEMSQQARHGLASTARCRLGLVDKIRRSPYPPSPKGILYLHHAVKGAVSPVDAGSDLCEGLPDSMT